MSVKSLLQLILFFLIILFIGGIYFLYFYSGPQKNEVNLIKDIEKVEKEELNKQNISDQEILEDVNLSKNKAQEKDLDLKNTKVKFEDAKKDTKQQNKLEKGHF